MKKTLFAALLALVAAVLTQLLPRMAPLPRTASAHRVVALMTDDDTGWFFLQLREGALAACAAEGARLHVMQYAVSSSRERLDALAPDAALLYLSRADERESLRRYLEERAVPCRTVLGEGEGGIAMDEKEGARLLAAAIPQNHSLCTVYSESGAAADARRAGALAVPGVPEPVFLAENAVPDGAARFARACLALDETATRRLMALKRAGRLPASMRVYGYDTGSARAEDLESGAVTALLMPMPYALGYLGAQSALGDTPPVFPAGRVVTRRTMLLSRNVRLMFPLLQTE